MLIARILLSVYCLMEIFVYLYVGFLKLRKEIACFDFVAEVQKSLVFNTQL